MNLSSNGNVLCGLVSYVWNSHKNSIKSSLAHANIKNNNSLPKSTHERTIILPTIFYLNEYFFLPAQQITLIGPGINSTFHKSLSISNSNLVFVKLRERSCPGPSSTKESVGTYLYGYISVSIYQRHSVSLLAVFLSPPLIITFSWPYRITPSNVWNMKGNH